MTRKEASQILRGVGIDNKFSLHTVDFSDLARCTRQFCTIKNWEPDKAKYEAVKQAFHNTGVIVDFA